MKRIILSVLAMSALLCGCQKDHVSELAKGRGTIQATIEEISATRTVMDEDNSIRWSEGDQIVGFMKSTLGVKYQVTAASVGKTSASFEEVSSGGLNAGTELEHIIAYYPYSSSVSAAKSGSNYTLDVILPTEQTYVAESFGDGAMPMVAVSETNNITFRNVCGGMKLQLKGTQKVASIKVEGKNGELLSGAATVTAYTDETKPAITMASGASTSVTLDCGSGVLLNESTATEFIVALPPVLFSKGFTVTVTDIAGQVYTVETEKANSIIRSSLLVMPEIVIKEQLAKNVVVFEFAAAWCVFCPEGYDNMMLTLAGPSMKEYKDAVHIMTFHSDIGGEDILAIEETDKIMHDVNINAFPAFLTNLQVGGELNSEGIGLFKESIQEAFEERPVHCGVNLLTETTDGKVKITSTVHSEKTALYNIALFVVEDKIKYYQKHAAYGTLDDYTHRYVVRKVITSSYKGELLGEIKAGENASRIFELEIDSNWNLDNTFIYALVIDDECGVNNMNICVI